MKLIICEKPSLAKTVANAIGIKQTKKEYIICKDDFYVTFAFGHLFRLLDVKEYKEYKNLKWKDYNLPIIPNFKFALRKDKGIKEQFQKIKELSKKCEEIINCGDSDREGQIIIDTIIKNIGFNKKITRLWLPDQTTESVLKQLQERKDNIKYINLQKEGYARMFVDWLFGINLTVYLTNKENILFNVGRVLVPITKFVFDRDKEIETFIKSNYYILESNKNNLTLKINKKFKTKEEAIEKLNLLKNEKAKVLKIEEKQIKKQPKKLFSLSKLQSELSKKYKMSFSKSLQIIQSLYEKGLLTYPRTNTEYLSENEFNKISKIIELLNLKKYNLENVNKKTIYDSSKVESHSAITITTNLDVNNLNEEELKVYNTVFNRFISNFLKEDTIISERKMIIQIKDEIIVLKGNTIIKEGFYKYEPQEFSNKLPSLNVNDVFEVDFKIYTKETEPPKHLSESELSNLLKNPFKKETDTEIYKNILDGVEIGTEATRTPIIEKIKKIGYIKQEKDKYLITDLGKNFINLLEKNNINLWKEKSIEFSKKLKEVYKEKISIQELIEITKTELEQIIQK